MFDVQLWVLVTVIAAICLFVPLLAASVIQRVLRKTRRRRWSALDERLYQIDCRTAQIARERIHFEQARQIVDGGHR